MVEIVDHLDISTLEGAYTSSGSDAYHPRMMLALLFYSYASGVFSSRKIEATTHESVPMRYVAANQHPDHDTICTFRRRFLAPLSTLFVQILEIAHQMDLVEVGEVSIDGSKVNANASKHKAMSWERACQAANDKQQLEPALDELEDLPDGLGALEKLAADIGYLSKENVKEATDRDITPYIATGRCNANRDDEVVTEDEGRPEILRKAQIYGRVGIWDCKTRDGVPPVPAQRSRQSQ